MSSLWNIIEPHRRGWLCEKFTLWTWMRCASLKVVLPIHFRWVGSARESKAAGGDRLNARAEIYNATPVGWPDDISSEDGSANPWYYRLHTDPFGERLIVYHITFISNATDNRTSVVPILCCYLLARNKPIKIPTMTAIITATQPTPLADCAVANCDL